MSTMFKSMMQQKAVTRPAPPPAATPATSSSTPSSTPKPSRPRPGLQRRDAYQDPSLLASSPLFSPATPSSTGSSSSHGLLSPGSGSSSPSAGGVVDARSPGWSPPPETLSR